MKGNKGHATTPKGFIYVGSGAIRPGATGFDQDIAVYVQGNWHFGGAGNALYAIYAVKEGSELMKDKGIRSKALKILVEESKELAEPNTEGYVCLGFGTDGGLGIGERYGIKGKDVYKRERQEGKKEMYGHNFGNVSRFIYYIPLDAYKEIVNNHKLSSASDAFAALKNGDTVSDKNGDVVSCIDPKKEYKIQKKNDFKVGDIVKVDETGNRLIVLKFCDKLYLVYLEGVTAGRIRLGSSYSAEDINSMCIPATLTE